MKRNPAGGARRPRRAVRLALRVFSSAPPPVATGFAAPVALAALALTACRPGRSSLAPASPEAAHTAQLWWLIFGVTAAIWLAVAVFALLGVRPRATPTADARLTRIVVAAMSASVVILLVFLVADFATNRALGPPDAPDALTIKLTGHQWWWFAEYQDPVASNVIQVANELHIPIGRAVQFQLSSPDVIHSFWVPSLQGKRDLIPGRPTTLWLKADRPGTYTGQCAEFCGFQHAHMGLLIVAETPEKFAAWEAAQRQTPPSPSTDRQRRGQQLFLTGTCVMCHTIDGTPARSRVGPPLSHLASQQTLGANTVPNTRDNLRRWILDPHAIKPGVRMPQNFLAAADLDALLDYLVTLK